MGLRCRGHRGGLRRCTQATTPASVMRKRSISERRPALCTGGAKLAPFRAEGTLSRQFVTLHRASRESPRRCSQGRAPPLSPSRRFPHHHPARRGSGTGSALFRSRNARVASAAAGIRASLRSARFRDRKRLAARVRRPAQAGAARPGGGSAKRGWSLLGYRNPLTTLVRLASARPGGSEPGLRRCC